jgi:uncharacterized protein
MLSFDLRSLESQPVQVSGALAPDDPVWQEGDPRPAGPIAVTGRLSQAGPGKFYFHGDLTGAMNAECRRCLTDVGENVEGEMHLIFAEQDDPDAADDPDMYLIEDRAAELDLRPALREQWLLFAPRFSLCSESCKGLCPTCGTDRNVNSCDCAAQADSRWDTLRAAKSGHQK